MYMKMTGAAAIVYSLEQNGVDTVFGYPGAANAPLYEAMSQSKIRHILPRGEQAAAHEANGYARVTGKPGVCFATSGPGATNLITGIANAYMDSVAIVAITGQVQSDQIGRDVFQEVDITGAVAPFCKHSYLVKDAQSLPEIINNAFHIAATGRPGPVLIDIPIDLQLAELDYKTPKDIDIRGYKPNYKGNDRQLGRVIEAVGNAKRPLIMVGGGVINSKAKKELLELAERINTPVVSTLMGVGSLPTAHRLNFGMVGSHGMPTANYALNNTDLLIVLGARAADRAISMKQNKVIVIHIDIDPAEIGKVLSSEIPVVGDIKTVLKQLLDKDIKKEPNHDWLSSIEDKKPLVRIGETGENGFVNPKHALKLLSRLTGGDCIITTEVGQNQIWTARNFELSDKGVLLTSGGLGTMGYGLPAAVGAKIGSPSSRVIAIEGDGSFQMSMGELATIAGNRLDIKIILFVNGRLGMVRELQKLRKYNYYAVYLEGNPDYCKLAAAYGIQTDSCSSNEKVEAALQKLLSSEGPYLLELITDPEESTL